MFVFVDQQPSVDFSLRHSTLPSRVTIVKLELQNMGKENLHTINPTKLYATYVQYSSPLIQIESGYLSVMLSFSICYARLRKDLT